MDQVVTELSLDLCVRLIRELPEVPLGLDLGHAEHLIIHHDVPHKDSKSVTLFGGRRIVPLKYPLEITEFLFYIELRHLGKISYFLQLSPLHDQAYDQTYAQGH